MGAEVDKGPYGDYYTPAERRQLRRAAGVSGVDAEIDAARVALMRMLGSAEAEAKPELLLKAVDAVVRSIRVRHQISGGAAENLVEAFDKILGEMGYGEE